jgi:hypothetical protein
MRLLIAGASGAIGRPLVRCLKENRQIVFALARSPQSSRAVAELGAEPVTADALDAAAVKAAIARVRPDAVINELTSLPRHYTAAEMKAAVERDYQVRVEGNTNLLAALRDAGVRRYLLQSSAFWYMPGAGLADESERFAFDASPAVAAGTRVYAELEAAASETPGIEFVSLRYGFFYGPGTGTAAKATWASRLAGSRFLLSAVARACGASCTSMMPPRQQWPLWNALQRRGRRPDTSELMAAGVRTRRRRASTTSDDGRRSPRGIWTGYRLLRDPAARRIEREGKTGVEFCAAAAGVAIPSSTSPLTPVREVFGLRVARHRQRRVNHEDRRHRRHRPDRLEDRRHSAPGRP